MAATLAPRGRASAAAAAAAATGSPNVGSEEEYSAAATGLAAGTRGGAHSSLPPQSGGGPGGVGGTEAGGGPGLWQRHRNLLLVAVVLLGWGLSEYMLVLTGKNLSWTSGMFYNCIGVISFNVGVVAYRVYSGDSEKDSGWRVNRWVVFAVLTGLLYAIGDVYFLKLSGSARENEAGRDIGHLADASVLAPLCALYILLPTALGVLVDGEPMTKRKAGGVLLALVSIMLLSMEGDEEEGVAMTLARVQ
jgi:hypothetical protein